MLLTFVVKETIMNSDVIVGYNKTGIGLIRELKAMSIVTLPSFSRLLSWVVAILD